jgi:hypothetical protein
MGFWHTTSSCPEMVNSFQEDDDANDPMRQLGLPETISKYLDEVERDEFKQQQQQQEQYDSVSAAAEAFQQALLEQFESAHYLAYELGRLEPFFIALDTRLQNTITDTGMLQHGDDTVIYPAGQFGIRSRGLSH